MNKYIILPLLSALIVSCGHQGQTSAVDGPPTLTQGVALTPTIAAAMKFTAASTTTPAPASSPTRAIARTPAPVSTPEAGPTAAFMTPKRDTNLPSDEQLAEGAASSIGTGSAAAVRPSNQPSTTIKPPSSAAANEDDDLAPGE